MPVTRSLALMLATLKKERIVIVVFSLSGASGLIFETICTRLLTFTFGNTAHAVSTVVSAFLGGLALGAFLIGRWADTRSAPLLLYGKLELLAGIYYLLIPRLFGLLTKAYVALCGSYQFGPSELLFARIGLSALVVLPPTILMGGTLPVLASFIATNSRRVGSDINRLYSWNTLGAALGALASTYVLMAYLGVPGSLVLCSGINIFIFLLTLMVGSDRPRQEDLHPADVAASAHPATEPVALSFPGLLPLAAFLTGALGLAYEVVWTHVLAFWVGNTVYAFGLMLFVFLVGLGWGARVVARRWQEPARWGLALAVAQLLLGLTVMLTLPLWARIPVVFEHPAVGLAIGLGGFAIARGVFLRRKKSLGQTELKAFKILYVMAVLALILLLWRRDDTAIFVLQETVRFLCAFYLLIAPTLLLGMSLPLLINLYTRESRRTGAAVGRVYAANTAGAICGSLLAGFVVLPRLGSPVTLRAAATANYALGVLFLFTLASRRTSRQTVLVIASALVVTACWMVPGGWDARRMSSGAYAYFQPLQVDDVLFSKEDIQGGLTTVARQGKVNVLLSNGKFQGDNHSEVQAQTRFAFIPMLFTHDFDNALVIGLGTGNTVRSVARFPFGRIDVAELAPQIVEASRQWFQDVNDNVFDRDARVHLHIADGRNFLLLSPRRFDLITAEITSIWISGEADLYNKEFYQTCRSHLTDRGILQQWVQIHHMPTRDLLVILNTVAQVFPHIAFFQGPHQGLLIASASPLTVDYRRLQEFDSDAGIQQELRAIGLPSTASLLGELVLYGNSMRAALASNPVGTPVSTDLYPYLEYQTPKGNALSYNTIPVNLRFLSQYRPPLLPPELLLVNFPSEDERNLFYGYVAQARGDLPNALRYFEGVQGTERKRAAAEILRIQERLNPNLAGAQ
jgi:spermidine synthase